MWAGAEAEPSAARLMPWGWVSVVPAPCHHGKPERGPSARYSSFLFRISHEITRKGCLLFWCLFSPPPLIPPSRLGLEELEAEGWGG